MQQKPKKTLADYLLGFEKIRLSPAVAKWFTQFRRFREDQINTASGRLPRLIRQSPVVRLFSALTGTLICTAANVYGAFLLSFGLSSLLFDAIVYVIRGTAEGMTFSLIAGAIASLLAVPLLLSSSALGEILQRSETAGKLLFGLFCFRHSGGGKERKGLPLLFAVVSGVLLTALGIFLPLPAVLLALAGLLYLCLAAASPEFSFLLIFLLLPLFPMLKHSELLLAVSVFVTFLSYSGKALGGKRMFRISVYDKFLFVTAFTVLIGGLLQKGSYSFLSALLFSAVLLGHLLASNLFINPSICRSAYILLLASSVPTAVYGVAGYLSKIAHGVTFEAQTGDFFLPRFAEATGAVRAQATFPSADLFAAYLAVCVVLSFTLIKKNRLFGLPKAVCLLPLVTDLCALFCTVSHEAWLALLLGYAAYRVFRSRKVKNRAVLLLLAVPALFLLIPADAYRSLAGLPLFSAFSFAPILRAKEASLAVLSDIGSGLFFGVGRRNLPTDFPSACSGVLSLVKAVGAIVTLFFFLLFLLRLFHLQRYSRFVHSASVRPTVLFSAAALFVLTALMIGTDLFAESTLLYLFCAFLGLGNAALRIAREESVEKTFSDLDNSDDVAEVEIPIAEDA